MRPEIAKTNLPQNRIDLAKIIVKEKTQGGNKQDSERSASPGEDSNLHSQKRPPGPQPGVPVPITRGLPSIPIAIGIQFDVQTFATALWCLGYCRLLKLKGLSKRAFIIESIDACPSSLSRKPKTLIASVPVKAKSPASRP